MDGFFNEHRTSVLGFFDHVGWDFANGKFVVSVIFVGVSLHINEVNDTADIFFEADWKMNGNGIFRQTFMDRIEGFVEIATDLVNLVNKTNARHAVFGSLAPHSFGLSFDTHLTIEHDDGAVEHAERAFHLGGKVDVARGINNVNLVTFPVGGNSSGSNGNTTFLFLFHPVGSCTTGVAFHEVNFVFQTGTIKNRFGGSSLAGVDVRDDTDIAVFGQVCNFFVCHIILY